MERLRLWIQTLSLFALATATSAYVLHDALPAAHADEAPVCQYMDSDKALYGKAIEDISAKAMAFLATQVGKQHVVSIPFGRIANGSGGSGAFVCAW